MEVPYPQGGAQSNHKHNGSEDAHNTTIGTIRPWGVRSLHRKLDETSDSR